MRVLKQIVISQEESEILKRVVSGVVKAGREDGEPNRENGAKVLGAAEDLISFLNVSTSQEEIVIPERHNHFFVHFVQVAAMASMDPEMMTECIKLTKEMA